MKVCIAEKPSVAREIARVVGASSRQDGYFEGNGYAVTWTFGHFCTLKTPDDYQAHWKRWSLDSLPMLPEKFETKLITNKGVRKQFGVIKKLLKKSELVINCGDAGQEGELIQRWVLNEAKYRGRVLRLWISSLTPEAIRDGFKHLKEASEYDRLYFAGSSRAIGDWLLGMNATRLFTLKYGSGKQVLSIGRVQTPTLALLVERHHEIANFVPSPFWELHTLFREVDFQYTKGRFENKEDGEELLKKVEGHPFTILSATKKKGKEYPPRLFDLTSLQVHANKRFSFTAERTLKIVQKLYEQKLVTYPRVDTSYLPSDLYPKISGILKKLSNYQQYTTPLLGQKIRKSSKVFNDKKITDHHAIIPTGEEKPLPVDEQKIYDAITRRFIAAFYPDCIVSNNTVIGQSNGVPFKATGKEILQPGWRVIYAQSGTKEKDEKLLPNFKKGDTGPHQPDLLEKMTQAPKNYSEATLLRAMETAGKKVEDEELRELMKANGIGRPSTRANIIETLFKRRYIRRQRKNILPTETGIQLIGMIRNPLLKSAELTGQWEKQLREIEEGTFFAKRFIFNMKEMVTELVNEVRMAKNTKIISSSERIAATKRRSTNKTRPKSQNAVALTELHCPKCRKGRLIKGKEAYGCTQYKSGCSFRLPFSFKGKTLPEKQLLRLMKKGSTVQLKGFKEKGQSLTGWLFFDDEFQLALRKKNGERKDQPTSIKQTRSQKARQPLACPKCRTGNILKGKSAYGCSRWKEGCDYRYPFEKVRKNAKGRPLTEALVRSILLQTLNEKI